MALSQEFRERLRKGLNTPQSSDAGNIMSWSEGQSRTVRMVPRQDPSKDVIVAGDVHFIGGRPVVCGGKRNCSLCEALWTVKELGRPDSGDLFKSYGLKSHAAWVMVDRADPDLEPRIVSKAFGFRKKDGTAENKGAADKMIDMFFDPVSKQDLDPSDPKNGFDIVIELTKQGYTFTAARSSSPLASTDAKIQEIIAKAESLNLDAQFSQTEEHFKQLEKAAAAVINGTLQAKNKFSKPGQSNHSTTPPVDTLAMAENASAPDTSTPTAAPAQPAPANPAPASSAAKSMADKIRERAANQGKAA